VGDLDWDTLLKPLPLLRKQSALWDLEQARILTALDGAGLRPVVLKGGALRHLAYDDPLERWMGDLDLLVHPEEIPSLLSVLTVLGYSSTYSEEAKIGIDEHHYHHLVKHPRGFIVEAHQGLTRPGAPCRLDPDRFFARSIELSLPDGTPMALPSREDMALHLVSQVEQEGCRRLSRIVDLDRLVTSGGDPDWNDIRGRAKEGNLSIALAVSLRLAGLLLSTPVPSWAIDGRDVPNASRRGLDSLRPASHLLVPEARAPVAREDLFRLWLLPSWPLRGARLKEIAARRADPLAWVWEGRELPDEGGGPPTGGPGRLLKLVAYQLWSGAHHSVVRDRWAESGSRGFWEEPPARRELERAP